VPRDAARECRAALSDSSGRHVCVLWWDQQGTLSDVRDIACGEQANLQVFVMRLKDARQSHDMAEEYFAYQPARPPDREPRFDGAPRFTESMSFTIRISYQFGTRELRIPATMTRNHDGTPRGRIGPSGF
jgi:hypothetical protein